VILRSLGGCAAFGRDLDRIIRLPWREVRQRVARSLYTPLHANSFARFAKQGDIGAVAEFFRVKPFARFGAIISTKTLLLDEFGPIPTIAKVLQARIVDVARWTDFNSLTVIFKSSQRADDLIEEPLKGFALKEGGAPIPVRCIFMRKQLGEPALEVADFVMHAVGRQARQNLKKRGDFNLDLCAVFHSADRQLTSFIEVESVRRDESVRAVSCKAADVAPVVPAVMRPWRLTLQRRRPCRPWPGCSRRAHQATADDRHNPYNDRPRNTDGAVVALIQHNRHRQLLACAVTRRRFPVGASPTPGPLQPKATGAAMEVTKLLKPSGSVSRIGDSASVQAVTRVNEVFLSFRSRALKFTTCASKPACRSPQSTARGASILGSRRRGWTTFAGNAIDSRSRSHNDLAVIAFR
jgi:hypothetical protein